MLGELVSTIYFFQHVNRPYDISLVVVDILVVGGDRAGVAVPLLGHQLADGVVGGLHGMAVGVGHLLQPGVAVLVGVGDQVLALALDADRLEIVEGVVGDR